MAHSATELEELASGKAAADENFPVASLFLPRAVRPLVAAYYRFARLADDIADHPDLPPDRKLAALDALERGLTEGRGPAVAVRLAEQLATSGISTLHAATLLEAFRRDSVNQEIATWDHLLDYCDHSAAPVGRFLLDIHGEDPALFPGNDALCAALQILNHLQDCGDDRRRLGRVYLPTDLLTRHGTSAEALAGTSADPGLSAVLAELVVRTDGLLAKAREFPGAIRHPGLRRQARLTLALALRLAGRLRGADPLARRVALTRLDWFLALWQGLIRRSPIRSPVPP